LPHLNNGNTPVMTPVKGNKGAISFNIGNHGPHLFESKETQTILDDQKFLEKYGYGKGFSQISKSPQNKNEPKMAPDLNKLRAMVPQLSGITQNFSLSSAIENSPNPL